MRVAPTALAAILMSCWAGVQAAPPDLNGGTWRVARAASTLRTVAGKRPPLLPMANLVYEQHLSAHRAGDLSWDDTEKCLAPGVPRLLLMGGSFEFLQRPEQIVIAYQWNHLVRTVDMNIAQPQVVGPTYEGQSVGRWDGGTLVIDTIGFNEATVLDSSGLPHSDALHVVERYTPSSDRQSMQVRISIDDPNTYSAPWETTLSLQHERNGRIAEDFCLERKGIKWAGRKKGT
jgi:hypothetical protein